MICKAFFVFAAIYYVQASRLKPHATLEMSKMTEQEKAEVQDTQVMEQQDAEGVDAEQQEAEVMEQEDAEGADAEQQEAEVMEQQDAQGADAEQHESEAPYSETPLRSSGYVGTECSSGFVPIEDEAACQEASENIAGKRWVKAKGWSSRPSGCISSPNGRVWWNSRNKETAWK